MLAVRDSRLLLSHSATPLVPVLSGVWQQAASAALVSLRSVCHCSLSVSLNMHHALEVSSFIYPSQLFSLLLSFERASSRFASAIVFLPAPTFVQNSLMSHSCTSGTGRLNTVCARGLDGIYIPL